MRRFATLFGILAVACTLIGCDSYKKMADSPKAIQISCTPEILVLNDGKIAADISATIPAGYFKDDVALQITPILFFEGGAITGEPFILQGKKMTLNGMVVPSDEAMAVHRSVEFDYQPAMDICELKLLVEAMSKSGKLKEFTMINANNGAVLSATQIALLDRNDNMSYSLKYECSRSLAAGLNTLQKEFDFAEVMQPEANNHKTVTSNVVKADLIYGINSAVLSERAVKTDAVAALKQSVDENIGNDRATQSVYVNGYASPDGPEKLNNKLSGERSQSGLRAVQNLLRDSGLNIDAAAYGEDWEGFKEAVAASNIEDKDLILQVLSMYSSSAEREQEIKNIASVFGDLKTEVLPQLRRAQVITTTDITGRTDAEIVAAVKAGKAQELTLEELLYIAESNPEIAEPALRVAAEKYGDARAYNNLAVILAKSGDYDGALKALDQAAKAGSKSEELNNNYALVYLAKGDTERAAEYAQVASSEVQALTAAAMGKYTAATKELGGYNAAVAHVQDGNLAAAKKSLEGDESAKADYLRAVIAAKEGNITDAKAFLTSAIAKDPTLAAKAAKDINLSTLR